MRQVREIERILITPVIQRSMDRTGELEKLVIRNERPDDEVAVRALNTIAFETDFEATLIDRLRHCCNERLSFVALVGNELVGHILFTPATVETDRSPDSRITDSLVIGMGLAPMAVAPPFQNRGIGSALVRYGVDKIRHAGYPFIIVLGHPAFYPRFGFARASRLDLHSEYDGIPDEAFMIMVLDATAMSNAKGVVRYRPEFGEVV